jgi:hypothetical protein
MTSIRSTPERRRSTAETMNKNAGASRGPPRNQRHFNASAALILQAGAPAGGCAVVGRSVNGTGLIPLGDARPGAWFHSGLLSAGEVGREEGEMRFGEVDLGPYRIYAGALESAQGSGYVAAVVVSRRGGTLKEPREAYRDTLMAGGHSWPSSDDALYYAIAKAKAIIRTQPHRLAC